MQDNFSFIDNLKNTHYAISVYINFTLILTIATLFINLLNNISYILRFSTSYKKARLKPIRDNIIGVFYGIVVEITRDSLE